MLERDSGRYILAAAAGSGWTSTGDNNQIGPRLLPKAGVEALYVVAAPPGAVQSSGKFIVGAV